MEQQPESPFTIDHLASLLDEQNISYVRDLENPALLVNFGCARVPHALRFVVDAEQGYLSIAHHDLLVLSSRVATDRSIGEACRLALLMNGEAMFGGFMLYGFQAINLGYCAVVPTAAALLTSEQLGQTVSAVCNLIDRAYPLLLQVLWGQSTADEAHGMYRRGLAGNGDDGEGDAVPVDGDDPDGSPAGGEDSADPSPAEIDRLDDLFLAEHDPDDQFSAAVADAIRKARGDGDTGLGDAALQDDEAA